MRAVCVLALLTLVSCAAAPAHEPRTQGSGTAVDMGALLMTEAAYRPLPGGEPTTGVWIELPRGAYVARGWYRRDACGLVPAPCGTFGVVDCCAGD